MRVTLSILGATFIFFIGFLSLSKTLGTGDEMANSLELWAGGDKALHFLGGGNHMSCAVLYFFPSFPRRKCFVLGIVRLAYRRTPAIPFSRSAL